MILIEQYIKIILEGLMEPPPILVTEIQKWALSNYSLYVYQKSKVKEIKKEALKYIDGNIKNPELIKKFKINLKDWKYFNQLLVNDIDLTNWLKNSFLTVKIIFLDNPQTSGIFKLNKNGPYIELYFSTDSLKDINAYRDDYDYAVKTIKHELIHFSQSLIHLIVNDKNDKNQSGKIDNFAAGIPSKKLLNKNTREYELKDEEFYTLLYDTIGNYIKLVNDGSDEFADYKSYDFFLNYVGAKNNPKYKNSPKSSFLSKIKTGNPEKWKKAVKEFYKEIIKRGIVFQ